MKEEKLEQLRKAFKTILIEMIGEVEKSSRRQLTQTVIRAKYFDIPNEYAGKLVYEVKIQINNK